MNVNIDELRKHKEGEKMPGYIEPVGMRKLNESIKKLNETVKNTNLQLPEIFKVSIPSIETPPPE
ncbi:MAG: hypothetical protein F6K39_00425 [Okeania sp. SIO3B3]|nr:hypothetical protein [Okeania sp. SIO3B3]